VLLVATEHVDPEDASVRIDDQVDCPADRDPVQSDRQQQQRISGQTPHSTPIVPEPGRSKRIMAP
jgi:hypothetical protein